MRIVGQESVAEAFGVAPKTIVEWQEGGFPVAVRGRPGVASEYDLPGCIDWLVQREVRKVQGESQRDRVFRLQGDRLELDLAKERGLLVSAEAVEPKLRAACIAAREMLLREGRTLAEQMEGLARPQREQLILAAHETFLRTLANWRGAQSELDEGVTE